MKQAICRFIYHKLLGWKAEVDVPDFKKCIICAAPHTTNWDLIIGKLFITAVGRQSGFLMKKEWFFFPLGILFRKMGGIPVHRDKRTSMVDQLVERIKKKRYVSPGHHPRRHSLGQPGMEEGVLLHRPGSPDSHRTDRHRLSKEMHQGREIPHADGRH